MNITERISDATVGIYSKTHIKRTVRSARRHLLTGELSLPKNEELLSIINEGHAELLTKRLPKTAIRSASIPPFDIILGAPERMGAAKIFLYNKDYTEKVSDFNFREERKQIDITDIDLAVGVTDLSYIPRREAKNPEIANEFGYIISRGEVFAISRSQKDDNAKQNAKLVLVNKVPSNEASAVAKLIRKTVKSHQAKKAIYRRNSLRSKEMHRS